MKKSGWSLFAFVLMSCGALGCSETDSAAPGAEKPITTEKTEIILSAAASLAAPLEQIKADLEREQPDLRLTVNLGASGTLQKQIEQGAPADLFWSAAAKQMDELEQKQLLLTGTRVNAASNILVLVVPKDRATMQNIRSFADLTHESVNKVGMGSPETVPAGTYGKQILQKTNVWDALQGKLVFGKDVKQVLTYVERGDVDAGIVYRSDAQGSDKIQMLAEADPSGHQPIVYPLAVLKNSQHPDAAKRVLDYLRSDRAQETLARAGFVKGVE